MSDEVNSITTSNKEFENLLDGVIKQEGLHNCKIEKAVGAVKGDGYIGIITIVKVIGKTEVDETKVVHLVVKCASKSDALRSDLPVIAAFGREIYMYNTVFPMFRAFETKKVVPPFSFVPKFYEGRMTHKNETVILENLKENGYRLYERRMPMDDNHVSLALIEYGHLHALSFALRDQNSEQFQKVVGSMDNLSVTIYKENFLNSLIHRCIKILDTLDPDNDAEVVKIFGAFANRIEAYLNELCETVEDNSVVLHGDCWTNNMMFKYEDIKIPSKPTKVCFIDFQLSSMGSPVLDLACFFYSCSSKKIINELNYYMQLYYNSLSTYMQKLGSDPDKIYPYTVFQEQWKSYAKFGLLMAVINVHAMLTEEDEAIDLKDNAESGGVSDAFNYEISNVDEYNDRIKHIISHFIENDLI